MEAEKISVIVPVYNCEKYLEKCLESICGQTYQNLEIILVEDGSEDRSPEICKEYEKRDKRIRVVSKKNEGVAVARNTGLDYATGDYIGFVDSDDYIDRDMYETLYANLKEQDAQMSICGIYHVYSNRTERPKEILKKTVNRDEAVYMVLESRYISVNPVNRLLKRSVYEGLRFPPGMTSEDAYLILDILGKVERVAIDLTPKYYYFHRNNSITTSAYKETDPCVIRAYEKNLDIVRKQYPQFEEVGCFRLYWSYFYVLDKMLLSTTPVERKARKETISFLRRHTKDILTNSFVGKGRKIACVALLFHVQLYKIFLLKYRDHRRRS